MSEHPPGGTGHANWKFEGDRQGDKNMSKGKEPEIIISSDEEDPGGDSQDEHVDTLNVRAPYQHVSILSRQITVPSLFVPLLLVFTVLGPCWDGRTQTDF